MRIISVKSNYVKLLECRPSGCFKPYKENYLVFKASFLDYLAHTVNIFKVYFKLDLDLFK